MALEFENEAGIKAALAAVRADADPSNWAIITYTDTKAKTLKLHGSGSGGLQEFLDSLADDMIAYGYARVEDIIDEYKTVKFVFVELIGENANRMMKARVTTHKSIINDLMQPHHVTFTIDSKKELTPEIIAAKVGTTSGSKSKVVDEAYAQQVKKEAAEKKKH